MQYRITKPSLLLNKQGELIQKGYATSPLLRYRRKDVARKLRLKEWDYYLINNEQYVMALTIGKSNSLLLISASFIDLANNREITKTLVRVVPDSRLSMPESSEKGNIRYQDTEVKLAIIHHDDKRELHLIMKNFTDSMEHTKQISYNKGIFTSENEAAKTLEVLLTLSNEPKDSMVIATPFYESKKDFYYNQKIIGMDAMGKVRIGDQTFTFSPDSSFGLLDWGRGVWPHHTTWYWSACQGIFYGNLFGFNLGYGFGDTSAATENMLFYKGVASKLEEVTFHIPLNDKKEYEYMKPWTISSSDHRLELIFTPILDRSADLNALILSTNQHQVFGTFTGTATLDDGTVLYLKDFLGFAERVENRW